jgi:hypothetical protein
MISFSRKCFHTPINCKCVYPGKLHPGNGVSIPVVSDDGQLHTKKIIRNVCLGDTERYPYPPGQVFITSINKYNSIHKPPAGENLKGSTANARACLLVQTGLMPAAYELR